MTATGFFSHTALPAVALAFLLAAASDAHAGCSDPPAPGVNWGGCNLDSKDLTGANLSGADLSRANLTQAILTRTDLSNADLRGAEMTLAVLDHADLSGALLSETMLLGANLSNANLSGAYLHRTNLNDTDLSGADFTGATVSESVFYGADFTGAIVKDGEIRFGPGLDGATWIDGTTCNASGSCQLAIFQLPQDTAMMIRIMLFPIASLTNSGDQT